MPYETSYIDKDNVVCITARGRLTAEEYRRGSVEVVDMLKERVSVRLLADDRLLENAASILDFYDLPRFFREIGLPSRVKVAVLYRESGPDREDIQFFETVCKNSGYNLTDFYSYGEAMGWLTNE